MQKENHLISSHTDAETVLSRRSFLKKSVYAAPTLMVLGSLTKPTQTHADFGPPPSDPKYGVSSNQVNTAPENDFGSDFETESNDNVSGTTLDNGL